MHHLFESKLPAIKGDSSVNVVYDVAHLHSGHRFLESFLISANSKYYNLHWVDQALMKSARGRNMKGAR
jgi:hypothetical protein